MTNQSGTQDTPTSISVKEYNTELPQITRNDFLQGFISQLVEFNEASKYCVELAVNIPNNLRIIDDEHVRDMQTMANQHKERIRLAVESKTSAFKKYETTLQVITQQEIHRQTEIYNKINECKTDLFNCSEDSKKSLTAKIDELRNLLFAEQKTVKKIRDNIWQDYQNTCEEINRNEKTEQTKYFIAVKVAEKNHSAKRKKLLDDSRATISEKIKDATAKMISCFDPEKIKKEYADIYAAEPYIEKYQCCTKNPSSVRIATLTYDLSALNFGKYTEEMLEKHYPALYRHEKLKIPFCLVFDESFSYLFELNIANKEIFADKARSLAMRLFMMIPPTKVNFTFIDPINLGETFAIFRNLVDENEKTNKVINGQIWSSETDIYERLNILTEHISNVHQRCLQGNYDNIQKYNVDAKKNAEPYEILMIMDFPARFNEELLIKLEQIISSGPQCGVYTIILKNAEQLSKMDEKIIPFVNNIENKIKAKGLQITTKNNEVILGNRNNIPFFINSLFPNKNTPIEKALFSSEPMRNKVIEALKKGIKDEKNITIDFNESILHEITDKLFKYDCSSELVIPIGTYGAKSTQNLVFNDRSVHALIGGQIGSGKSSLLHTIIMSAILKYSADELQIFLIDFKDGVEFKIYANHKFDIFNVIAIESEREFGESVLDFIAREQKLRAEKFKRINVGNIHEYREKSKRLNENSVMPRILLIVDECHKLFSKDSDLLNQTVSKQLSTIITQGRGYGFHVILATQSMSEVGGISQGVLNQVGIRIALKCPKADQRLVLGDGNEDVDQLVGPGHAVYNSDCGNKVANNIFRVSFIDQDEQTTLLHKISERAEKEIKLKQEPKKPDTRILLSNVEENINSRYQKYNVNGINEFNENTVVIGESLQLFGNLKTIFTADRKSNMLIISSDAQKARTTFTFCSLSLILGYMKKHENKKPSSPFISIIDYAPPEDPYDIEGDTLKILSDLLPAYIRYTKFIPFTETSKNEEEAIDNTLKELYSEMLERDKDHKNESKYLLIFGLQRADKLRSSNPYQNTRNENVAFGGVSLDIQQELKAEAYDMFLSIIDHGAEKGIHSIIWVDYYKNFTRHYSNKLDFFRLRVGFTMSDEDSGQFMDEPYGSRISENNAIFNCYGNQKFRPYKKPDQEWLKKIFKKINCES